MARSNRCIVLKLRATPTGTTTAALRAPAS